MFKCICYVLLVCLETVQILQHRYRKATETPSFIEIQICTNNYKYLQHRALTQETQQKHTWVSRTHLPCSFWTFLMCYLWK